MKGKKEQVRRGQRQGLGADDDLMLLKLVLDEHPRLRDRVVRYIEAYRNKTVEQRKQVTSQLGK